jgi:broad specificity phosphatase PhoE
MTRVYLVRHGATEWNREEIFRGRADCPLNETGRAEARAVAHHLQGTGIEKIYSSPLSRAAETAQAVAAATRVPVIFKASFTDLDFGDWQGMALREVKEKYPDMYRIWRERPEDASFPGGETLKQARVRAWQGLLGVLQENPEKTVLIVSHRVITKLLICAALGLDESHFWNVKQDTTAINCLEYARERFVVSLLNDTCHLKSFHSPAPTKDF